MKLFFKELWSFEAMWECTHSTQNILFSGPSTHRVSKALSHLWLCPPQHPTESTRGAHPPLQLSPNPAPSPFRKLSGAPDSPLSRQLPAHPSAQSTVLTVRFPRRPRRGLNGSLQTCSPLLTPISVLPVLTLLLLNHNLLEGRDLNWLNLALYSSWHHTFTK